MNRVIVLLVLIYGLYAEAQLNQPKSSSSKETGKCSSTEYKCADSTCIESHLQCNGAKDCADGSDETINVCQNFYCPPYAFRCTYGGCIDGKLKCDGQHNCADNSDEAESLCIATRDAPAITIGSRPV